jgi:hypothetical protein
MLNSSGRKVSKSAKSSLIGPNRILSALRGTQITLATFRPWKFSSEERAL